MSTETTSTTNTRTLAELERQASEARRQADEAAHLVREAQLARRREVEAETKRQDEGRERARKEREAALRQALPPEIAAARNGLVALRDWLQASPWPPGHNGHGSRALGTLDTLIAAVDEAQDVRHADAVKRAELEANPAPVPVLLSPTWMTKDAALVVAGAALARGAIEYTDASGKRWALRPSALVSFATAEQAQAIELQRAQRIDYLRRTTSHATPEDARRWERDADETIGFVVRDDQASDLVGLALRWSGMAYVENPAPLVADVLRGCTCSRAAVRWAAFAERRGWPLQALTEWMREHPTETAEALRFWSEAGADLETANG